MIKRKLDNLGRIVIPIEMRNELGIKNSDEVDISLEKNKIVITKPNDFDIEKYITDLQLNENISTETYRVLDDILKKL